MIVLTKLSSKLILSALRNGCIPDSWEWSNRGEFCKQPSPSNKPFNLPGNIFILC